jgi:hypothetical protein
MNNVKQNLLDEAGKIVNGARRKDYGTPEENFARIAKFWQAYMENTGRAEAKITAADVSPLMRLMKEARLCETPSHRDSFVDIIGYTLTGAEINLDEESDHWASDLTDSAEEAGVLDYLVDGKGAWFSSPEEYQAFLDSREKMSQDAKRIGLEVDITEEQRAEEMAMKHLSFTERRVRAEEAYKKFKTDQWSDNVDGAL